MNTEFGLLSKEWPRIERLDGADDDSLNLAIGLEHDCGHATLILAVGMNFW